MNHHLKNLCGKNALLIYVYVTVGCIYIYIYIYTYINNIDNTTNRVLIAITNTAYIIYCYLQCIIAITPILIIVQTPNKHVTDSSRKVVATRCVCLS